ncbi:ParA family protein [Pantoea vagans]|uniref:ParA family protein n=1 Tax=Pantoea vagans TaxID=470934 RepID=UPI00289D0F42|nr:ParA family protein [Pantoea vagans]
MLSGISYENRRYSFKGGGVKSTFSLHLAGALAQKEPTLLVDADPQRSIMAVNRLKERGLHVSDSGSAQNVRRSVFKGGGFIVIDSPPRTDVIAKAVVAASDIILVPITPGPFEVLAFDDLAPLLKDVSKVRIVLNRTNQTAISKTMREAIEDYGFKVLQTEIPQLVDYQESIMQRLGVTEYKPGSVAGSSGR